MLSCYIAAFGICGQTIDTPSRFASSIICSAHDLLYRLAFQQRGECGMQLAVPNEIPFSALRLIEHCWSVWLASPGDLLPKIVPRDKTCIYIYAFLLDYLHTQLSYTDPKYSHQINHRKDCRLKKMIR